MIHVLKCLFKILLKIYLLFCGGCAYWFSGGDGDFYQRQVLINTSGSGCVRVLCMCRYVFVAILILFSSS